MLYGHSLVYGNSSQSASELVGMNLWNIQTLSQFPKADLHSADHIVRSGPHWNPIGRDVADEPLIFFHPNTPHGKLVRQIFADADIEPNISIETRFSETAPNLMREGFGIALQDELTSLGLHNPNLKILRLTTPLRQPVLMHCRSDNANDPDISLALGCLVEAVKELGLPDEFS